MKKKALRTEDIKDMEKNMVRWRIMRNVKGGVCVTAFATAIWTGSNADVEDDFLVLPSVGVAIVGGTLSGVFHAKKEEQEEKLDKTIGRPSKKWVKLSKYSALTGMLSLGTLLFCCLNETKEDTEWLVASGLVSGASLFGTGYALSRYLRNKKDILSAASTQSKCVNKGEQKSDQKCRCTDKKTVDVTTKMPGMIRREVSPSTILWSFISDQKPFYSFSKERE